MVYGERINEIRGLIETYLTTDTRDSAEVVARLKEESSLKEALERYAARRNGMFDELSGLMGQNHAESEWESEIHEARDACQEIFNGVRNDMDTNSGGRAVVDQILSEEDSFFDRMAPTDSVAFAMDEIATYRAEVAHGIEFLRAVWERAAADANQIMRTEDTMTVEIKKLIDEATTFVATEMMKSDEIALRIAKNDQAVDVGMAVIGAVASAVFNVELNQAADVASTMLKNSAEMLEAYRGKIEIRKDEYKKYLESDHSALLITYRDARERARSFREDHDYERLKTTIEPTYRILESVRSNGTSGQRSDAESWTGPTRAKIEAAVQVAQGDWDNFVRDNATKFFGPVTPDLDKALVGSARWDTYYSSIASDNLQELLEKWIGTNRQTIMEVDQTTVPEIWQPELRAVLMENLRQFAETATAALRTASPKEVAAMQRQANEALMKKFQELG